VVDKLSQPCAGLFHQSLEAVGANAHIAASMRRIRRLALLLMTLLAAMSSPARAAHERLILAFGDSLTAGYGLRGHESFPAQLEAALRAEGRAVRVVNAGVSGETTAGGRQRLPGTLARLDRTPDAAIVELGANDMLTLRDPADARANLDAILTTLRARGIPVILCGMFSAPQLGLRYLDAYNDIYPDLARKHGATLYPFFLKGVAFNQPLLLDDGLHPNAQGVALVTRNILPTVRRMLDDLPAPAVAPPVTVPVDAPPVHRN
jgi:acyl-CoA thioesterase-1